MTNIEKGTYTEEEIKAQFGKDVVAAYSKNSDNPNETQNPNWYSEHHPESGERLSSVKSYCDKNNTNHAYYSEYKDKNGNSYCYVENKDKSVDKQIYEDRDAYAKKQDNTHDKSTEQTQNHNNDGYKR